MQTPRRNHVRLPVQLLDPMERLEPTAPPRNVDDHHQRRSRGRLEVRWNGRQQTEDVGIETVQLLEQPWPRPQVRRLGLEAGRHWLAGRALTREQATEFVHARAIRLHQVVHDFLDRPFARNGFPGRLDRGHALENLVQRRERRGDALADGLGRDSSASRREIVTGFFLELIGNASVHRHFLAFSAARYLPSASSQKRAAAATLKASGSNVSWRETPSSRPRITAAASVGGTRRKHFARMPWATGVAISRRMRAYSPALNSRRPASCIISPQNSTKTIHTSRDATDDCRHAWMRARTRARGSWPLRACAAATRRSRSAVTVSSAATRMALLSAKESWRVRRLTP